MLLLRSRDYMGRIKVKFRNKTTTHEYNEIKSSMKIYTLTISNVINVIYINDIYGSMTDYSFKVLANLILCLIVSDKRQCMSVTLTDLVSKQYSLSPSHL